MEIPKLYAFLHCHIFCTPYKHHTHIIPTPHWYQAHTIVTLTPTQHHILATCIDHIRVSNVSTTFVFPMYVYWRHVVDTLETRFIKTFHIRFWTNIFVSLSHNIFGTICFALPRCLKKFSTPVLTVEYFVCPVVDDSFVFHETVI